jgi:hypothetical protein
VRKEWMILECQEEEEKLPVQERDRKLKPEHEDFLCPEVKLVMNVRCGLHFDHKPTYFSVTGYRRNDFHVMLKFLPLDFALLIETIQQIERDVTLITQQVCPPICTVPVAVFVIILIILSNLALSVRAINMLQAC